MLNKNTLHRRVCKGHFSWFGGWWSLNCLEPEGRGCSVLFLTTCPVQSPGPDKRRQSGNICLTDPWLQGLEVSWVVDYWSLHNCKCQSGVPILPFSVPLQLNTATWQVHGSQRDVSKSLKGRVLASQPLLTLFWWKCECDGWRWRPSSWGSPVLRTGYRRTGS